MSSRRLKKAKPRIRIFAAIYLLVVACAIPLHAMDGKGPISGLKPLDDNGRMHLSPEDRCPVCGMKALEHRKFAGAIQLRDNTTYYFCGTGCMIRSWVHPEIFLGKPPDELRRPVVKEYFTGRETDARDLVFVAGSDIIGPMGPALVPVMDAASVTVFKSRHGGTTQFRLQDMNDNLWLNITGKKMMKR